MQNAGSLNRFIHQVIPRIHLQQSVTAPSGLTMDVFGIDGTPDAFVPASHVRFGFIPDQDVPASFEHRAKMMAEAKGHTKPSMYGSVGEIIKSLRSSSQAKIRAAVGAFGFYSEATITNHQCKSVGPVLVDILSNPLLDPRLAADTMLLVSQITENCNESAWPGMLGKIGPLGCAKGVMRAATLVDAAQAARVRIGLPKHPPPQDIRDLSGTTLYDPTGMLSMGMIDPQLTDWFQQQSINRDRNGGRFNEHARRLHPHGPGNKPLRLPLPAHQRNIVAARLESMSEQPSSGAGAMTSLHHAPVPEGTPGADFALDERYLENFARHASDTLRSPMIEIEAEGWDGAPAFMWALLTLAKRGGRSIDFRSLAVSQILHSPGRLTDDYADLLVGMGLADVALDSISEIAWEWGCKYEENDRLVRAAKKRLFVDSLQAVAAVGKQHNRRLLRKLVDHPRVLSNLAWFLRNTVAPQSGDEDPESSPDIPAHLPPIWWHPVIAEALMTVIDSSMADRPDLAPDCRRYADALTRSGVLHAVAIGCLRSHARFSVPCSRLMQQAARTDSSAAACSLARFACERAPRWAQERAEMDGQLTSYKVLFSRVPCLRDLAVVDQESHHPISGCTTLRSRNPTEKCFHAMWLAVVALKHSARCLRAVRKAGKTMKWVCKRLAAAKLSHGRRRQMLKEVVSMMAAIQLQRQQALSRFRCLFRGTANGALSTGCGDVASTMEKKPQKRQSRKRKRALDEPEANTHPVQPARVAVAEPIFYRDHVSILCEGHPGKPELRLARLITHLGGMADFKASASTTIAIASGPVSKSDCELAGALGKDIIDHNYLLARAATQSSTLPCDSFLRVPARAAWSHPASSGMYEIHQTALAPALASPMVRTASRLAAGASVITSQPATALGLTASSHLK